MPSLDRIAARLAGEIERLAWRQSRMRRPGVVEEYDAKRHMARARLSKPDGQGGLTPWCRIQEAAGAQTSRTTLTKGQTVWVDCPNGDIRQASIVLGAFSDTYKSSSEEKEETRFERGDVRVAIRPDAAEMSFGATTVTLTDGHVSVHTTGSADFT